MKKTVLIGIIIFIVVSPLSIPFPSMHVEASTLVYNTDRNITNSQDNQQENSPGTYGSFEQETFASLSTIDNKVCQYSDDFSTDPGPEIEWEKTFGETNGFYNGYSVQQTFDGGFIVLGSADFADTYLIKTDASGNTIWERYFSEPHAYCVQQTTDGGYIVVGWTEEGYFGGYDAWMIKTDFSGNELWRKIYGGPSYDVALSAQQTTDSGYIIVGGTRSFGSSSTDIWLIKTDEDGNEVWSKTFDGFDSEAGQSVQQTKDGGFIVAGLTTSFSVDGVFSIWLIKTDENGNEIWNRVFGEDGECVSCFVRPTTYGGYLIVGSKAVGNGNGDDIWVIKTDSNGNMIWEKYMDGGRNDVGYSGLQTKDGGYIISGKKESWSYDDSDIWLIKLKGTELIVSKPPLLGTIGSRSVYENDALSFTLSASDPENDPLTFSASNLPAGAKFDKQMRTFSWTPSTGQAGTYSNIRFSVTDGTSVDYEDITITVEPAVSGGGEGPRITGVYARHDGNKRKDIVGTFVSRVDVENLFTAQVWHPEGSAAVTSVDFTLNGITVTDSNGTDGWSAEFNMGSLADDSTLVVVAWDKYGVKSEESVLIVDVLVMPSWLQGGIGGDVDIGSWSWTYKFKIEELAFEFNGHYEPDTAWDLDIDSCAVLDGSHSMKPPSLSARVKYHLNGVAEIEGGASSDFTLFGGDASLSGNIQGTLTDYLKLAELIATVDFALEYEIPTPWSIPLPYFGDQGVVVYISPHGEIEVNFAALPPEEKLSLQYINAPVGLDVGAKLKLGEESLTIIPAYIEVYLIGNGSLVMAYQPTHEPPLHVDNAEVSIRGGVIGKLGYSWLYQAEVQYELGPYTWNLYDAQSIPDYMPVPLESGWIITPPQQFDGSETQYQMLTTDYYQEDGFGQDGWIISDDKPDDFPVVAADGNNQATSVWVHTTEPEMPPVMDLYYSMGDGENWTIPTPLVNTPGVKLNPAVTYINDSPMVVWVGDQANIDTANFTEWVSGLEIYSSMWDGFCWMPPQPVTGNSIGEGIPALASNGTDAITVWTADPDNNLDTRDDLELYYSCFNGMDWTGSQPLTNNTFADSRPRVAWYENTAIATWIQDMDSDDETLDDRKLRYSVWDGAVWSSSQPVITSDLAGVSDSDIEFTDQGIPAVTWVSTMATGNGTFDRVYYSEMTGGEWANPAAVSSGESWIRNPNLGFDTRGNALVSWVSYGEGNGDLYYAVRQAETGIWIPERQLTDNNLVNWQLSMGSMEDIMLLTWLAHDSRVTDNGTVSLVSDDDDVYYLSHLVAPDLEIPHDEIRISNEQPAVGEVISVNATVYNHGDLTSLPSVVRFFDGDPENGGVQTGTDQAVDSLIVNGSQEVSVNWAVQAGEHTIYAVVDPDHLAPEFDKENNSAAKAVQALPDLTIKSDDIVFSNITPLAGENVTISARIFNHGGTEATNILVRYFNDDPLSGGIQIGTDKIIPLIQISGNATVSAIHTAVPGHHNIFVEIDAENTISEYSESNNNASAGISVLPDLGLTSKDIHVYPDDPVGGHSVTVNATIYNYGGTDSPCVTVTFYNGNPLLGGVIVGEDTVDSLPVDGTTNASVSLQFTTEPIDLFVVIDPSDALDEWNEDNNVSHKEIAVTTIEPGDTEGWILEVIDSIGNVGDDTCLAFDNSGNPGISYYDLANENLKYAHYNGTYWDIQTVDTAGINGRYNQLVYDNAGNPVIIYYNHTDNTLKCAWMNDGSWEITILDSCYWSYGNAMVLDSQGYPVIAYYNYPECDLKLARYNGQTWEYETVYDDGSGSGWGRAVDMDLDSSDHPGLAFRDPVNGLRYMHWNGTEWNSETVDSGYGTGADVSFRFDENDNPCIAYYWQAVCEGPFRLKYARFAEQSWSTQVIEEQSGYPSLAFDAAGNPCISYYNDDTKDLKYASYDGSAWHVYSIDSEGNVGLRNSLAFDTGGKPVISYFDAINEDLKVARLLPSDITPPTVLCTSPEADAQNIGINTVITVTFDEAMDSSTINANSFTLTGSQVPGTVSYDPDTYTATFTPDSDLEYDHSYTATLTTAVKDLSGNPLANTYTWSFTTEPSPTGTLNGLVLYDDETPIEGIIVDLQTSPDNTTLTSTTTDANGAYVFANIPYGDYRVYPEISSLKASGYYGWFADGAISFTLSDSNKTVKVNFDITKKLHLLDPFDNTGLDFHTYTTYDTTLELEWEPFSDAQQYCVQVNESVTWALVHSECTSSSTVAVLANLEQAKEYWCWIGGTNPEGTYVADYEFIVEILQNDPPAKPENVVPEDTSSTANLTPTLQSSSFSDSPSDTHTASQWQIRLESGDYSTPVFDSGIDIVNLTQITIPQGTLDYSTTYFWQVKYQDNHGAWSEWSDETSFTCCSQSNHEDFTLYNEVDPEGKVTVTPNEISFSDVNFRGTDTYVYDDKGEGYFNGDFEHTFTAQLDSLSTYSLSCMWMISNTIDDRRSIMDSGENYLDFEMYRGDPGILVMRIREFGPGFDYEQAWGGTSLGTPYYIKIIRDESVGSFGRLYCYIYSNPERTDLVSTLHLDLHSKTDFRYVYGLNTHNDNQTYRASGYVKDLILKQVEPIPDPNLLFQPEFTWLSGSNGTNQQGIYGTKGIPNPANVPGARHAAFSWSDSENNFWLFGGYGYDINGSLEWLNDLWKFDGESWTWIGGSNTVGQSGIYGTQGIPDSGNTPGARAAGVSWIDQEDNLWLFGGEYNSNRFNDVWRFDGDNWTWIGGSDTYNQPGVYGTIGVPDASNIPGARRSSGHCLDDDGNLWLFGGVSNNDGESYNDLWRFDGINWTWITGSNVLNQPGNYGVKGVSDSANIPGSRYGSALFVDDDNNIFLFGGLRWENPNVHYYLNDLWMFDGTNWTWINGSNIPNDIGNYGTIQIPDSANTPKARAYSVYWQDSYGNSWLFGGRTYKSSTSNDDDENNDLWKYDGANWTWMAGADIINQPGIYGEPGTPAPENIPGARSLSSCSKGTNGNIWIFGGYGFDGSGNKGYLNDLWQCTFEESSPQFIPGDANGDGVINVVDMTKVARIILELDPQTPGADANQDGIVNVLDMTRIARIILQLDDVLPSPQLEWIKQFGTSTYDEANDICITNDSLIVAGIVNTALPDQTSYGGRDSFISKYDLGGNVVWTDQYGISQGDEAFNTAVDGQGNVIVVGTLALADELLPGNSEGEGKAYIRKYDSTGNEIWTKQFGLATCTWARNVCIDSSNNIYVSGETRDAQYNTPPDDSDIFIRKYLADGSVNWTLEFGTSDTDECNGMVLDDDGNILIAGTVESDLSGETHSGGFDAFVRKYTPDGAIIWTRQFGTAANEKINAISVDGQGNILVGGYTEGTLPGQVSSGYQDAFIRKYDPDGNMIWTKQFGTEEDDVIKDLVSTAENRIISGGFTKGVLESQTSSGEQDAFI